MMSDDDSGSSSNHVQYISFSSAKRGGVIAGLTALLLTLLLPGPKLDAADGGVLRGFVTDSTNGEAVAYANVVLKGTSVGATTNARGYFLISSVPPGIHTVVISCMGFSARQLSVPIRSGEITHRNILLVPASIQMKEQVIVGEEAAAPLHAGSDVQMISTQEIQMQPVSVEADIFRVLQSRPGVTSTGDVTSRYYVRGGGSDQNLVLLNGATVYNPFHALGIFSVIDPEMISMLEFYSGGFPPEYGGRLSSILNVVTKDGNKNGYHGSAQASLLSAKTAFEGPIPGGSMILTGRKSYYAKTLRKYLNGQDAPFDFYDLSFKVNYSNPAIDENGKLVLHGFVSSDQLINDDPLKEDYGIRNIILGVNWHKVWASPLYSRMNISYSGFSADVRPNLSPAKPRANSVADLTWNWDFTYTYESRDELTFGMENKLLKTELVLDNLYDQHVELNRHGWGLDCYVDYRFRRWEKFWFDVGLRPRLLAVSSHRPFLFEPRISLAYRPSPLVSFSSAFGVYSQEVVSLTDEKELISIFEPWVIVPDYLNPPQAIHTTVGVKSNFIENLTLELEWYYKYLFDLMDANPRRTISQPYDYINVQGESYGLELLLKSHLGPINLQTSYSLSWAFTIRDGVKYVPGYDSRHSVNALAGVELGGEWTASASWALRTGLPFTPMAGFYDRIMVDPWNPTDVFSHIDPSTLWGNRNSRRLPVYHRLDVGIAKRLHVGPGDITVGASIVNVYDRKNIFYFDRDTGERVYMLRFSPSLTVKAEI